MTELTLSNAEIENASLLANFKELDDLSIYDCPNLVSLDGLSAGALVNLSISNCAKLSDISALANADDLRFFRFWKCPNVQDFRPLSGLPKLQGFELSGVPVSEKQLRFLRDQFPDADVRVSSNGVSVYRKENPGPLESTIGK